MVFNAISNVEQGVEWVKNNYDLLVSLITAIVLGFNIILNGIRNNRIRVDSQLLKNDYKAIASVVDNSLSKVLERLELFEKNNDELISKLNEKDKEASRKEKLIILALQTSNIHVSQRQLFLKALNDIDDVSVEDTIELLEKSITSELEHNREDVNELDNAVELLSKE